MIDSYTRVLEIVAETGDEKVADAAVTKLVAHLSSLGRTKMLSEIARELRKVAARRKALAPKVEVAHRKYEAVALKAAATLGIVATTAEVNTSLLQGWRAQSAGKLADRSAKRALIDIYKKVIL